MGPIEPTAKILDDGFNAGGILGRLEADGMSKRRQPVGKLPVSIETKRQSPRKRQHHRSKSNGRRQRAHAKQQQRCRRGQGRQQPAHISDERDSQAAQESQTPDRPPQASAVTLGE